MPETSNGIRKTVTMKTMWAPWRIDYILGEKEPGCIFCKGLDEADDLTLFKGRATMVMMNKFPYINGHLLAAPVRHVADLSRLDTREMGLLLKTVEQAIAILKKAMQPDGFNVGLNLGRVAGAGVEEHLHFHIVPRWFGDCNALSVFADVRVIPEHLQATFNSLKPYFDELSITD